MVTLCCAIIDVPGSAFPVDIDGNKLVGHLKYEIQKKNPSTITCDAKDLQLFLAKSTNGDWVREDDPVVRALEEGHDHPDIQKMLDAGELSSTRRIKSVLSSSKFSNSLGMGAPTSRQLHMLVRLPQTRYGGAVAFPALESRMQQSVLRVSWEDVFSAIALVVDRTATHVYLLTNLHVWIDEVQHLSGDFQTECQRYVKLNSKMKAGGGETRSVDGDALERKASPRSTESAKDPPRVVVEQLLPDASALAKVYEFTLDSDICWRSSADFDYAIFELPVTPEIQHLTGCKLSVAVHSMMNVDMFGFSDARLDKTLDQPYAILPARTTGWSVNKMRLSSVSAPRFSGGAIVCTKWGIVIGYVDGGFDGSTEAEQYRSYGYTFHGLPADMPSLLPRSAEE